MAGDCIYLKNLRIGEGNCSHIVIPIQRDTLVRDGLAWLTAIQSFYFTDPPERMCAEWSVKGVYRLVWRSCQLFGSSKRTVKPHSYGLV